MKRKNLEKYLKQTIVMALTLTLAVPMAMPAFCVEAQETEVLEDLQLEENSAEVVEDMEYVVYIDTTKEVDGTEIENSVEEEISISQNTTSENDVLYETNKPDEIEELVEENFTQSDSEEIQTELKESIEQAEEILSEEGAELVKDEETIIYTADLTQGEIEELQESEASIIVEENIELFGASKKSQVDSKKESKKETKEKGQKNTKEASKEEKNQNKSDKKETSKEKRSKAYDLKMAIKQSSSEAEEEPEWNVNMVNGDVTVPMEGETVKVAVMDSGIELLSGIPVQQINNMVATEQYLPYYMNDMTGHGTAIAGIIHDIAPNAEIYSVRIMDAENKATLSRVVEGIYWCIENDIDIINMSFGTTVKSAVLEKAIQDANEAGILLVSSAGNGDTQGVEYPAAYKEVIAVGAVNTSAKKTEESAVGEEVELVAPGEQILSDSMLGLETVVSGTSMAAPHVTAVAAMLWQKDKTKSPAFIRSLLAQTANELGDTEEYGNGLIDLEYALKQYDEFAEKYKEPEKDITSEEISTIIEDKSMSDMELNNIFLIIKDDEQLIKENTMVVETYEDVDYVKGRWEGKKGHMILVSNAISEYDIEMSEEEIAIFKLGAVYPDTVFKVDDDKDNKNGHLNWHGGFKVNYIANYRFATKVAKHAGDKTNCTKAKGQTPECYNQMQRMFKEKIYNANWESIICGNKVDEKKYYYSSLGNDENRKKKWRQLFLYGMASHIVTDTFAHSAYCRCGDGGSFVKVSKAHDDDNPKAHSDRFSDAQEAMSEVILNYVCNITGSEIDFSPRVKDWGKKRGYCLKNLLKYAREAAVDSTEADLITMFKAINY